MNNSNTKNNIRKPLSDITHNYTQVLPPYQKQASSYIFKQQKQIVHHSKIVFPSDSKPDNIGAKKK